MDVTGIIKALEQSDAAGGDATRAARNGFLEWALTTPGNTSAETARAALALPAAQHPTSAAAQAFVSLLHLATTPISRPSRRRARPTQKNRCPSSSMSPDLLE